jgi:phosphate transport system substrate-binding protein
MLRILIALALVASSTHARAESALIKVDGSSTVFPVTEAVSEEFQAEKKGAVRLTVGISGTGGGFKKFCRGETDVQNASRPILKNEMEECRKTNVKYFELPVGFDAIAVVVNPKNNWVNSITVDELKTMWETSAQGKITKWKQVNAKWPEQDLKLYGAGADSGTFDYFTEAVTGKAKASRGDYTASEDDNTLVLGVANDQGALGFMPLSYYEANKGKLKLLALVGGPKSPKKDKAVTPNKATVIDGSYYPLSRPIFIYVSEASYKKAEVKEFVDFYLKNAAKLVSEVNYIPLPAKAYTTGADHLKKNKLGTAFGGHPDVGLTIEQILKKEASL